jgi:DNA-binding response OmpR family regulator
MQTILVIDDDPAQVKMIEMTLAEASYKPVTATNGEDGLKVSASISLIWWCWM